MKVLVIFAVLWNFSTFALAESDIKDLNADRMHENSQRITVGAFNFKNSKPRSSGEIVTAKRPPVVRELFSFKTPHGNDGSKVREIFTTDSVDADKLIKQEVTAGFPISGEKDNFLNDRHRRSVEVNHKDALRDMIFELYETLKDPENYRNLMLIISALQEELENNPLPSGRSALLQNLLTTIMKRRFNSWGGKRDSQLQSLTSGLTGNQDQQTRSNFYAWGGRRKKFSDGEERQPRRFNAWGGKRDQPSKYVLSKPLPEPADPILSGVDLNFRFDDGLALDQLNHVLPENGISVQQMKLTTDSSEQFDKRHSFNAWGGKRSGYDLKRQREDIRGLDAFPRIEGEIWPERFAGETEI